MDQDPNPFERAVDQVLYGRTTMSSGLRQDGPEGRSPAQTQATNQRDFIANPRIRQLPDNRLDSLQHHHIPSVAASSQMPFGFTSPQPQGAPWPLRSINNLSTTSAPQPNNPRLSHHGAPGVRVNPWACGSSPENLVGLGVPNIPHHSTFGEPRRIQNREGPRIPITTEELQTPHTAATTPPASDTNNELLSIVPRSGPRTMQLRYSKGNDEFKNYPSLQTRLPDGVTWLEVCQRYPNHLWDAILIEFEHQAWTMQDIWLNCHPDGRRQKQIGRPWNYLQQRLRRAYVARGLKDVGERNPNKGKRKAEDMEEDVEEDGHNSVEGESPAIHKTRSSNDIASIRGRTRTTAPDPVPLLTPPGPSLVLSERSPDIPDPLRSRRNRSQTASSAPKKISASSNITATNHPQQPERLLAFRRASQEEIARQRDQILYGICQRLRPTNPAQLNHHMAQRNWDTNCLRWIEIVLQPVGRVFRPERFQGGRTSAAIIELLETVIETAERSMFDPYTAAGYTNNAAFRLDLKLWSAQQVLSHVRAWSHCWLQWLEQLRRRQDLVYQAPVPGPSEARPQDVGGLATTPYALAATPAQTPAQIYFRDAVSTKVPTSLVDKDEAASQGFVPQMQAAAGRSQDQLPNDPCLEPPRPLHDTESADSKDEELSTDLDAAPLSPCSDAVFDYSGGTEC